MGYSTSGTLRTAENDKERDGLHVSKPQRVPKGTNLIQMAPSPRGASKTHDDLRPKLKKDSPTFMPKDLQKACLMPTSIASQLILRTAS